MVSERDRFISDEVIKFIETKLAIGNDDVERHLQPAC